MNAQNSSEQFYLNKAKEYEENLDYQQAQNTYKELQRLQPQNIQYAYKVAECAYRLKDYPQTIQLARDLLARDSSYVDTYRLLGNCLDVSGNYSEGVRVLTAGTKRLPYEGSLYLDLGIIELLRNNYNAALDYWEAGIVAAPRYADNYYFAAKTYATTDEPLWTIMYAEIFCNIEKSSDRFTEMSRLLYQKYLEFLEIEPATSPEIYLNRTGTNTFKNAFYDVLNTMRKKNLITFNKDVGLIKEGSYLNSVSIIRMNFIKLWNEMYADQLDVPLFDWMGLMYSRGYLHAYNHWLFGPADSRYVVAWQVFYKDEYNAFITWFLANPLIINPMSYFVRSKYQKNN